MRAIAISDFGGPERLRVVDLPRPRPERDEVLVRVVAAGVNPVDWKIREGRLRDLLPHAFPLVPGWDAAGVVEELGERATRFRKGDRVFAYARKPVVQWGCYAEYVAISEASLALMPTKLLYEEAASVPLAALTAWQCLFGRPGFGPGSTLLVHGGSGGVGHFAVQLARHVGAEVWAVAGTANQEFLMRLGARRAIDYSKEDFVEVLRRERPDGVDLALCSLDRTALERSLGAVRRGGRLVSITEHADSEAARAREITAYHLFVEPSAEQLTQIARLVDQGRVRPHVQTIYRLDQAAEAQTAVATGHVRGKVVLNL